VAEIADNLRFHHVLSRKAKLRTFASLMYQATSWKRPREVVEARMLAAADRRRDRHAQDVDVRYVVTSLEGSAQHLYENVYCQRGADGAPHLRLPQINEATESQSQPRRLLERGPGAGPCDRPQISRGGGAEVQCPLEPIWPSSAVDDLNHWEIAYWSSFSSSCGIIQNSLTSVVSPRVQEPECLTTSTLQPPLNSSGRLGAGHIFASRKNETKPIYRCGLVV
jgi:hypothetical protein